MKFGFGIPNAGAAINGADIVKYVQRVEQLGYESIWTGDHIILPTGGTTQYPYTADGSFPLASTENFLEPFTLLAYVAAVTKRVKIGTTVIILPYRNPIEQISSNSVSCKPTCAARAYSPRSVVSNSPGSSVDRTTGIPWRNSAGSG